MLLSLVLSLFLLCLFVCYVCYVRGSLLWLFVVVVCCFGLLLVLCIGSSGISFGGFVVSGDV